MRDKKWGLRLLIGIGLLLSNALWMYGQEVNIKPSLVLHFDEGKGEVASSSGPDKINCVIKGSAWVDGKMGKALHFDGKDDYVEIPTKDVINPLEGTIECWVNPSGTDHRHILWAGGGGGDGWGSGQEFNLSFHFNNLCFFYGDENSSGFTNAVHVESPNITAGEWQHIAVTWKVGDEAELYINGELSAKQKVEPYDKTEFFTHNWLNYILIGKPWDNQRYFEGTIDEIKIWKAAKKDFHEVYVQAQLKPLIDECNKKIEEISAEISKRSGTKELSDLRSQHDKELKEIEKKVYTLTDTAQLITLKNQLTELKSKIGQLSVKVMMLGS